MSEADYGAPIIERRGGKDVTFPRLLMDDYGVLESSVRARRKASTRALLDECKISGKEKYAELQKVEEFDVSMGDVQAYVRSYEGAKKCFEMSLSKAGQSPESIAKLFASYDVMDAANLCESLVGFSHRVKFEEVARHPLAVPGDATPASNTPSSDASTA